MRRIQVRRRPGGLTFVEAVNVARKRVQDGEVYLISRHGGWFRPGAHGYCSSFSEAGVFDAATARGYLDVEGLSVVPISSLRGDVAAEMTALNSKLASLRAMADIHF